MQIWRFRQESLPQNEITQAFFLQLLNCKTGVIKMKLIFGLLLMMLAFQNCANQKFESVEEPSISLKPTVDGGGGGFTTVYNFAEGCFHSTGYKSITVDLIAKTVLFELPVNTNHHYKICTLTDEKVTELDQIVNDNKICKESRHPGETYCQALGIEDFKLKNSSTSITLQPIICGTGQDLCGDAGQKLRKFFKDLPAYKDNNLSLCGYGDD